MPLGLTIVLGKGRSPAENNGHCQKLRGVWDKKHRGQAYGIGHCRSSGVANYCLSVKIDPLAVCAQNKDGGAATAATPFESYPHALVPYPSTHPPPSPIGRNVSL